MKTLLMLLVLISMVCVPLAAVAEHPHEKSGKKEAMSPSANQQVMDLEKMCEDTSVARTERHTKKTLFERLGKEKGIHRLTKELVRVHLQNEQVAPFLEDLDSDMVANRVAQFMISGMGGPTVYKNRPTLPDSHRHMKLTNGDFMAAGGDMIQAMKNLEYGQNEIDEVVCALVGLRDQVVLSDSGHGH